MAYKGKSTARMVLLLRALGEYLPDKELRNPDHFAHKFLKPWARILLLPGVRNFCMKVPKRMNWGVYYLTARTRFFDDTMMRFIKEGIEQFVILGAGFDSRPYRFEKELRKCHVIEVDHPGTAAWKYERLRQAKVATEHVTFLKIDFQTQNLKEELSRVGFSEKRKTFFLWEGVTPYLSNAAVESTLKLVAGCASGSGIAFDYGFHEIFITPDQYPGALQAMESVAKWGEPFTFGIPRGKVGEFVGGCGLALEENLEPKDVMKRYLTRRDGVEVGHVPSFFGFASAKKK